jgi:hypothetical protein
MKAAVVHSFDQPLSLEDVPVPEPGPEQVLDGSAPAPRMVFRLAAVPTASAPEASAAAIA